MTSYCNPLERNSLGYKQCNVCKDWKDESEFNKYKGSKDGLQSACRVCQQKQVRKSREKNRVTSPYVAKSTIRNEQGQKQCSKCKQWKDESEFCGKINSKDGLNNICRSCQHIYDMARSKQRSKMYHQIKEQERKQNEKYNEKGQLLQQCFCCKELKVLNSDNFAPNKQNRDGYLGVCRNCIRKQHEAYMANLSDEEKERMRIYKLEYMKEYRKRNRDGINRKKRKENLTTQQILGHTISSAIYQALKGRKSERHWENLVDYSIEELKEHLEKQFTPEMNWYNMGEYWELDHIIPQSLFTYESEQNKQFKICWSLKNLRPLEKIKNKSRPKYGQDVSKEQAIDILGHELYCVLMGVENDEKEK